MHSPLAMKVIPLTGRPTIQLLAALLSLLTTIDCSIAQQRIIVGPGGPRTGITDHGMTAVDLPTDRTMARGIDRAKDRIAEGEYSQAIRFLDEVLAGDQDSFIANGETGEHTGLKETASEMIRDLPEAGREMYESMFGPVARKKLNDAVAVGDVLGLRKVAQQYFYTPAGYEAAMLVAQHEADAGRHLSASLLYDQLLNTPAALKRLNPQLALLAAKSRLALGETERAGDVVASASKRNGTTAQIAGRQEQLNSAASDPLKWYEKIVGVPRRTDATPEDQWLMSRGNAARNGQAAGGLPHMRVRWEARLLSHPQFETIHNELWASLEQRRQPLPTAGAPLAIGNTIISTTAHNVIAVDFRTGKRVWQTEPQRVREFEQLLSAVGDAGQFDANTPQAQAFARRVWDDYLYNSVSSDGQCVFVIRDLKLPEFNESDAWALPFRGGEYGNESVANRLCAYDLATQGKLVWEIDGAVNEGELAGAYFLGAPVVVDQKLYCLAEIKSAIHLVAIERQTGEVAWLQQLAGLQNGISLDMLRRLQAAMPSYDSGMLVCPTGAGVVIGINLEKLALAWAYQYETNNNPLNQFHRDAGRLMDQAGQWIESAAILADGCALLAPPESNSLHCLDLITGKLRWKRDRGDGIFVAGVEDETVLIVGLHGLTAVSLQNGKPLWQAESQLLPSDAMPSGRGFFSAGKYFLPLTTAEVVAVDLASGQIVERTQSRSGAVLGNLISHEGAILSQNGRFLDCFDQIDVLREYTEERLAENPDDFDALRTLGELTYNEGKLAKAIALLERAYELSADDSRTREVLGECLLEAIEQDFAAYHDRLPELREILAETPAKTLALLRIEAQGLLELGALWESFEVCLRIHEATVDSQEILQVAADHQASAANWLRAQTAAIWQAADAPVREKIVDRLTAMRKDLPPGDAATSAFLESFGGIEKIANDQYVQLADGLADQKKWLAAQQFYLDYTTAEGPYQAAAVASCSRMLHDRAPGLARLAVSFDEKLAGPLADVTCLDGKTGRELLAGWGVTGKTNALDWPYGKVIVDHPPQANSTVPRRAQNPLAELRLEQGDDVLNRCNLFFSRNVGELVIRDSQGREVIHQLLGEEERQFINPLGIYGVSRGNLLIMSLGQQITAIDTLALGAESGAVLWRKTTVRNTSTIFRSQGHNVRGGFERPGSHRTPRSQENDRWVGVLGPLTRDSFIYQDQRGLHCVDPLTGKLRWMRTNTLNACQLFGNESIVIAVAEGSTKAQAYNVLDGRSLGEVDVPRWNEQLATRGLNVIAWERLANGENLLFERDVMNGSVAWQQKFPRGAQVDVAMNRYVAVVEPTGRYVVIDALDGSTLVDYETKPIPSLQRAHLFAGTDQFVIAAEIALDGEPNRSHMQFNPLDFVMLDGQMMAFAVKGGTPLWSRPAEVRHESLMLAQPVDSPIITFVGNHNRQGANGSQQLVNMLLLEKSSGRVLFSDEGLPQSANHCATVANPETQEVLVEMVSRVVRLKFTDSPRPPEPPATYQATPTEKEGPKGIFGILNRFGGK